MTREEAIKNINALNAVCGQKNFYDEEFQEALRMAIKALEQEPIEKDGTLIVTTEHCKNVGRVLVQYGTNGTLFYQDQEPFMNKACVSSKVCEHDKEVVLGKIKAEIDNAIEFERKWLCDAGHTSKDIDIALNAIKSKVKVVWNDIEKEPVLDKIRAEIEKINLNKVAAKYEDRFYGFQQEVIKILDKYKAESEKT